MATLRTPADIARVRLANQLIAAPAAGGVAEAVAQLGALQAQDFRASLWSAGARVAAATEATVTAALADGSVVRTWPLRGTIHMVAGTDVHWMLELIGPRLLAAAMRGARHRQLGITPDDIHRSRDVLRAALGGGVRLTRAEVFGELERAGITTTGQRGIHLLWCNAHDRVICIGPHRGRQPTFVLLDEWVPRPDPLPRHDALARLARRYFDGHGPATERDFAWWSGLTLTEVREGIGRAGDDLVHRTVGGVDLLMSAGQAPAPPMPESVLLPAFDEFLLGYADRGAVLDREVARRVAPGANGIFLPTWIHRGRVAGVWRRQPARRGRTVLTLSPFQPVPQRALPALTRAAERLGAFIGEEVELEVARPT